MMKVHATASTFVFCRFEGEGWKIGLVLQPRLGKQMVPGGHVEDDETPAQAALREVVEESGLEVRLLRRASVPLPQGYPLEVVVEPWWTTLVDVPRDNHLAEPHKHLDHQYVAVADSPDPVAQAVHEFGWYRLEELADLDLFDDTRRLAEFLFPHVDVLDRAEATVGGHGSLLPA
ncbi:MULTISPECIES: NUDIX domain-containing protein [Nocardia]|uniref:NUDIX hydrolase n=1 Tax=Nocardia TaxID=1817 RepID=UPI001C22A229|nr:MULTISPECIES: NUDIX domain-containing protein [Nocardia]